jgi:hypothetical protein
MAAEDKIKSLKQQLREATNEARELGVQLANVGENVDPTKVAQLESNFKAAAARAAKLNDDVKDVNEQINVLTSGSKFEKISNSIGDIGGKIASLDFGGASESASRLVELTKTIKFGDAIKGVKDLGSTLANLGKALLTNPLFLIVAAIAAIGLAVKGLMDKQRADVDAANEAIKDSNESRVNEERKLLAKVNDDAVASYELKKKLGEKNLADTKAQIKNLEDLESSLYGLSEDQEKELANLRKQYNQQRVDNELLTINEINRINGLTREYQKETFKLGLSERNREIDDLTDWYIEQQRLIGDNNEAKLALDANFASKQKALVNKFRVEDADEEKKKNEKIASDNKEAYEKNKKAKQEQEDVILALEKDSYAARLIELDRFYDSLRQKANGNKDLLLQIKRDEDAARAVLDAQEKTRQENVAEEIKPIIRDVSNVRLESNVNTDNAIKKSSIDLSTFKKEKSDEEIAQDEQVAFGKVDQAARAFDALGGLLSAFSSGNEKNARKAFEINKAFALGTAIANTGLAVTAALTAGGNPIKLATSAQFVEAGIAATIGAANIVKIAQSKFQGGSSGGGGGSSSSGARPVVSGFGSSSTPATPAFNLFGQGNQLNTGGAAQAIEAGQGGAQPLAITVQVSESEITSTQNFVRRVNESATL